MRDDSISAVVLCAGNGTRMKSNTIKVLHPLLGQPMCFWPIASAFAAGVEKVVAVVGHQGAAVEAAVRKGFPDRAVQFAVQAQQKGTGDAVRSAREALADFQGAVLILYGDVPLLTAQTLQGLIATWRAGTGPLALVSCRLDNPTGYGRVVRAADGAVQRIVEHKDATAQERSLTEANAGIYLADARFLFSALEKLSPQNAAGELYLTDIVAQAAALGPVAVVEASAEETAGVNDRVELAARAKVLQRRINESHQREGVTLEDPESTFIEAGVTIGRDSVLGPCVSLGAGTRLGERVRVGRGCVLTRAVLDEGVQLQPYTVLEETTVGPGGSLGPFTRCRPGTVLGEGVHLGNFVETKKATLGKGTKAGHLAYLGDAVIGMNVNIGAGTITCNYDGVNKNVTTLGDGVFVGSDSQLVAPVTVGAGAYVAAGTTVTQSVPADALALSRAPQVNKPGWAAARRKMLGQT
jgi:bifunctional UDP-N-acetylglucosamine pyrophosphorylase/glucosamine-1-phosphate N-acetyltransferase